MNIIFKIGAKITIFGETSYIFCYNINKSRYICKKILFCGGNVQQKFVYLPRKTKLNTYEIQ